MKNTVSVNVETRLGAVAHAVEISPVFLEAFQPVDWTNEPLLSPGNAVVPGSAMAEKVIKMRKDAAEDIAKGITEAIMTYLSSIDTKDGY